MGQKPKKQPKAEKAKQNSAVKGNNAPAKAQTAVKTIQSIEKTSKFEYIVVNIISLFLFLAFGYLAIMSFLQTSVIDPAKYSNEVILYQNDIVSLNLLFTAIFFIIASFSGPSPAQSSVVSGIRRFSSLITSSRKKGFFCS